VESVKKDAKESRGIQGQDGKAQTLQAEKLLLAVGRKPMTENCGLEKSKAKLERGFVHVGDNMETAEKGCMHRRHRCRAAATGARGDDGRIIAVTHIAGKPAHQIVKTRIPNATYCEPQIGSIGLTEKQARDVGYDVKIGKFPLWEQQGDDSGSHGGFVKVVSDETYARCWESYHRAAGDGTSGGAATVLNLEGTIDDMMNMMHAHPTVWEAMAMLLQACGDCR